MKRRILAALLCCLLLFGCALAVSAESNASYVENISTFTSDGECNVTLKITIHLDSVAENLTFPLPKNATDIKVNGSGASTTQTSTTTEVDLSKIVGSVIGDFTFKLDYKLTGCVAMREGNMILELPIISGFAYPVESMKFTVTLPGQISTQPSFTASYQQSSTESNLKTTVNGNMISGEITSPLKDHEAMVMTMTVDPEMFQGVSTYERTGNPEIIPMIVCGALALLYWLIFLRTLPLIRVHRATPPEGVSAGELGCRLTFAGADLTMMVFNWAQLGYIMIHLDDNGRVWLHKRMEMGNERSLFEVKCFKALFGKRRTVDGTGYQYARLCLKFAKQVPGERAMCKPRSGNIKIFRILGCGVNLFGGVCLAMNLTGITLVQILLAVILGILGAVSAWWIQTGMYRIHIRGKNPLYLSNGLCVFWLLVGIISGQFWVALAMVLSQLLIGLMAAYGGRRSEMGRQNASQILGLRHYLKTIPKEELHRIRKNDPEFFFNMIPYAIAMGVDTQFARLFGSKKLRIACPYFVYGRRTQLSAGEWAKLMREAADILDARQRQMEWEKFAIVKIR